MKKFSLLLIALLSLQMASAVIYNQLWVVGNATSVGWNPSSNLEMEKIGDGIFTWTGPLLDNSSDSRRFKFLTTKGQWHPSVSCRYDVPGHLVIQSGVAYDLYERPTGNEGNDNSFQVSENGTYRIDVDLNTMKMTCTKTEGETPPDLEKLFTRETLSTTVGGTLNYRKLAPESIVTDGKYPLVIFLHGAGERGTDNAKQLAYGAELFVKDANRKAYPAYVLFPQCPDAGFWPFDNQPSSYDATTFPADYTISTANQQVKELIDSYLALPEVDERRVYIIGLSMGAMGVYDLACRFPDTFASALPICGGVNVSRLDESVRNIYWRIFHGGSDGTVTVENSRTANAKLLSIGTDVTYTEYPNVGHDSWNNALAEADFLPWLFSKTKKTPAGTFPIILEAEDAQLFGDLLAKPIDGSLLPKLSGGRHIGAFHKRAHSHLKYEDIEIPEEGTYELRIFSIGGSRPLAIKAANYEVMTVRSAQTGDWNDGPSAMMSTLIYLNKGKNTLQFGTATDDGPNLDKFEIHTTDQVMEKPAIDDNPFPEQCEGQNDYKISYMGSSVCYGSGATEDKGYAYMYTNLLKERYEQGIGQNWKTSNISVGGNKTIDVLNRWDNDISYECSRYVLFGLSLGNERSGTTTENACETYKTGMLQLIDLARERDMIPVMANNYTNRDFNQSDYSYLKQLNLVIHEWDVPSINTLGAIDDGAGKWADGYEQDGAHPNTAGHAEFFYAIVPSLFDALDAGKPLPQIVEGTSYKLGGSTTNYIEFTPENIVHPFTLSFEIKTSSTGTIASFETETGNGLIKINGEGKVVYESPSGDQINSTHVVTDGEWQRITLTHYHAWGVSMLYVNDEKTGQISEKLVPQKFALCAKNAPDEVDFRQLFFWRSGMNVEEIAAVNAGKLLKSSLEIYAPLGGEEVLVNLAQSTNTLNQVKSTPSALQLTNSNLFIFPNPVKKGEEIKIAEAGMLQIYSLAGQLVSELNVLENSIVSTDTLAVGTYLIQLSAENTTKQAVLIIK